MTILENSVKTSCKTIFLGLQLTLMQGQAFLDRLKGVRKVGENAYLAFCPAHDNHNTQSLSVKLADRILLHCFGCGAKGPEVCEALGLDKGELNYDYQATSGNGAGTPHLNGDLGCDFVLAAVPPPLAPLTLAAFAEAKGLPIEFLSDMGVAEEKSALKFKYLTASGQRAPRQRLRMTLEKGIPDKRFLWSSGAGKPIAYGLWRLKENANGHSRIFGNPASIGADLAQARQDLYLVEGESDALTLWLYNFRCLGIPGASLSETLPDQALDSFSRVFIVKEADQGGQAFEEGLTARLAALNYDGEVRVLEMESLGCKDANEAHLKFAWDFPKKWAEASAKARKVELPMVGLEVTMASDIKPEKVEWLWDKKVPLGKITVFVGDPKKGKSFVTLNIAAQLSTGNFTETATGSTLIFSGEDSAADTIVPRLHAMGADLTRIGIVNLTRKSWNGQIIRREFNLGTDLDDLRNRLKRHPDIRLVIVDPFTGFMGDNPGNNNPQMRSLILTPLHRIAEEFKIAVILVTHFTKNSQASVMDKVNGTKALVAAARMIWAFIQYGEHGSLMGFADSNIVGWQPGLAFHIEETENAGMVMWDREVTATLAEILEPKDD